MVCSPRTAFGWPTNRTNRGGRKSTCGPLSRPAPWARPPRLKGSGRSPLAGGVFPAWRPDGKELYYLNPAGVMMAASITVTGTTLAPGAPVVLFPTRVAGGGVDTQQGRQYDVGPDGRFLINIDLDSAAAPITLLMNWKPEGRK